MSSSVRYQYIKNTTGVPLTVDNFAVNSGTFNDGDDKQERFIHRVITAADIGTDAGQLGEPYGAIVSVIPMTTNVLFMQGNVYRPSQPLSPGPQNGMTMYQNVDNQVYPIPTPTDQCEVSFGLGLDNTIRVADKGADGLYPLAVGDVVTVRVITGTKQFSSDVMNP